MHFICRSFIGKNNPDSWSQYWENEPDNELKLTKGHLFGLVNLKSNQGEESVTVGKDIISEINQLYFSCESKDIILCLKDAVTSLTKNPIFSNYQIDVVLIVVLDNQLYIATYGTHGCLLQRGSKISQLISGKKNQFLSLCGPIQDEDRILLVSSKFLETITWEGIKRTLVDENIQNIEEDFLSSLYSVPDQNYISAALIECHPDISTPIIETGKEVLSLDDSNQISTPIVNSSPIINNKKIDSIFVHHQSNFKVSRRKKNQLVFALILIIGLCISIYYGNQKNKTIKAEASFNSLKTELELKLSNINALKSLDLEAAVDGAKEAEEIVQQMINLKINQQQVSQYKEQIDAIQFQTGGDDSIIPQMVQDTSFIVSQPQFSNLYFFNNNLYLLDSSKGRLDVLNPQTKSTQSVIISDSIKSATHLLFDNNNLYILVNNKLSLIGKNSLSPTYDFEPIKSTLSISDIDFWNGSLYVLDNQNQLIWKLAPNSDGFSNPQKWLKNDFKLEIGSNSLAIDGQIWVLNQSGQVTLYTSGVKDKFDIKKQINFIKTSSLITDPNSDYIVFNDNSQFIYVYKKNGEFYSKYNLSKLKIVDLAFDSQNKIIYFLSSDQKIYQITL